MFTESKIDDGCAAMLTVKVFNSVHDYGGMEFDEKHCKCTKSCEKDLGHHDGAGLTSGGDPSANVNEQYGTGHQYETAEMSLEKGFMVIVGSIIGGVVFLIIIAILLIKLKNSGKFRRTLDGSYEG